MRILLSIKPEFVKKIFSGEKKYEFRKTVFKDASVKKVVIYACKPVSKIVGEFSIDTIIEDDPKILWKRTHDYSGINETIFKEYFKGKEKGYAIKVKKCEDYSQPFSLEKLGIKCAPQSFMYLN